MSPKLFRINIQKKIVAIDRTVVITTYSPARSESASMLWAIGYDAAATGVANMQNTTKNSLSLKPSCAIARQSRLGTRTSLSPVPLASGMAFFHISER